MKKEQFWVMDSEDMKRAEKLRQIGLSMVEARIITVLESDVFKDGANTKELAIAINAHQPAVSIAVRELGFLDVVERKTNGKGRPMKVYTLNKELFEEYKKSYIGELKTVLVEI